MQEAESATKDKCQNWGAAG